jgi:hypothetical protein
MIEIFNRDISQYIALWVGTQRACVCLFTDEGRLLPNLVHDYFSIAFSQICTETS